MEIFFMAMPSRRGDGGRRPCRGLRKATCLQSVSVGRRGPADNDFSEEIRTTAPGRCMAGRFGRAGEACVARPQWRRWGRAAAPGAAATGRCDAADAATDQARAEGPGSVRGAAVTATRPERPLVGRPDRLFSAPGG